MLLGRPRKCGVDWVDLDWERVRCSTSWGHCQVNDRLAGLCWGECAGAWLLWNRDWRFTFWGQCEVKDMLAGLCRGECGGDWNGRAVRLLATGIEQEKACTETTQKGNRNC